MQKLIFVFLGSGVGGGLRYLVGLGMVRLAGAQLPAGTFTVNVLGSFAITLIMQASLEAGAISEHARLFMVTGVLGGFTTYSSFAYETLWLAGERDWGWSAAYVAATTLSCLVAGWCGIGLARQLAS